MKIPAEMVAHNRDVHDRIAATYDNYHVEIYNPTEQTRLRLSLSHAVNLLQSEGRVPFVLDFGAGTGNLTNHLLQLGVNVVAADVSTKSLDYLVEKMGLSENLKTLVLNGEDLTGIDDETFDMVATYSVLHHVPDYLKIVEELQRVTKSGGIIYLDHEVCPSYWKVDTSYFNYLGALGSEFHDNHLHELNVDTSLYVMKIRIPSFFLKLFSPLAWKNLLARKLKLQDRENTGEGDIHVTLDDHIDWDLIGESLQPYCDEILKKDYLICRELQVPPVCWNKWKNKCVDMRLMIYRKK